MKLGIHFGGTWETGSWRKRVNDEGRADLSELGLESGHHFFQKTEDSSRGKSGLEKGYFKTREILEYLNGAKEGTEQEVKKKKNLRGKKKSIVPTDGFFWFTDPLS